MSANPSGPANRTGPTGPASRSGRAHPAGPPGPAGPVIPPEPAGRANGDQSAIFRTLANPLRRRILGHLQEHREANSASLARALGESTGTTSYHLRKLAEQRFVEEIPEKSSGRERWWRALPFHIQAPDPGTMAAAERSALLEQTRAKAEHDIDLYFRVLTQYAGPEGWAQSSRGGLYMTKEELHEFYQEYLALQWKYGHATAHEAPESARPVALRFFAVPDEEAAPGGGRLAICLITARSAERGMTVRGMTGREVPEGRSRPRGNALPVPGRLSRRHSG